MVLRGLNILLKMSTRSSGTSVVAVWISNRPAEYAEVAFSAPASA
jgi:hypothetical protein